LRFAWTEFVRKYVNAKATLEKQRIRRDGAVLSGQSVARFAKYDLCLKVLIRNGSRSAVARATR
jgi:hypothetical protein